MACGRRRVYGKRDRSRRRAAAPPWAPSPQPQPTSQRPMPGAAAHTLSESVSGLLRHTQPQSQESVTESRVFLQACLYVYGSSRADTIYTHIQHIKLPKVVGATRGDSLFLACQGEGSTLTAATGPPTLTLSCAEVAKPASSQPFHRLTHASGFGAKLASVLLA
jgi:hypothetical protein